MSMSTTSLLNVTNPWFSPKGDISSSLSHHLSPWHGVLLVSRVPVSKIVHVSTRVHRCPFGSHADVPQWAWRGRGWRRWGQVLPFGSTGAILHDLFVFGTLVLEPYLHLETKERWQSLHTSHVCTINWSAVKLSLNKVFSLFWRSLNQGLTVHNNDVIAKKESKKIWISLPN